MAREAYYDAIRDLGIARDTLQMQIGTFLAAVLEARKQLILQAPKMVERFDKATELAVDHLMDDLLGDTPVPEDVDGVEKDPGRRLP